MDIDRIPPHDTPRSGLADLTAFAPPADLRDRVLSARKRQFRARHMRPAWLAVAAAAVIALVIGWPQPATNPTPPDTVSTNGVIGDLQESQSLEAQWQKLAAGQLQPRESLARVRMIDATLQSAYDRGADSRELSALWQRRNHVLRGMITRLRSGEPAGSSVVTRI